MNRVVTANRRDISEVGTRSAILAARGAPVAQRGRELEREFGPAAVLYNTPAALPSVLQLFFLRASRLPDHQPHLDSTHSSQSRHTRLAAMASVSFYWPPTSAAGCHSKSIIPANTHVPPSPYQLDLAHSVPRGLCWSNDAAKLLDAETAVSHPEDPRPAQRKPSIPPACQNPGDSKEVN